MANAIVGRKRTATGVLIEVRALADKRHATPEELTEYVTTLIAAADVVCEELKRRRAAMLGIAIAVENARAAAHRDQSELGRCPHCAELDCAGDCKPRSADAPLQYPCGCPRAAVVAGKCSIFDRTGNVRVGGR